MTYRRPKEGEKTWNRLILIFIGTAITTYHGLGDLKNKYVYLSSAGASRFNGQYLGRTQFGDKCLLTLPHVAESASSLFVRTQIPPYRLHPHDLI